MDNFDQKKLEEIEKLIESGKMGDMPDLVALGGKDQVFDLLCNDKEKFAMILALLAVCVEGKYIRLCGKLASTSIKYKKEKKGYLPNIALDILCYLKMIQYLEVREDLIVIKMLDDTLINDMNKLKLDIKQKNEYKKSWVDEYYKDLESYKDFFKRYQNDYTRTSE